MCLQNDLKRYAPTTQASCWTRMKFHPVTWEERLCKIGKNSFIKTLVEAKRRNGKSWRLGFRVWGFRVGVCVCLKLFLFAACTALPACVRAYLLEACRARRRKKVGQKWRPPKFNGSWPSLSFVPLLSTSFFAQSLCLCCCFSPFRFVKVCRSLGVSLVRVRLLGILHFKLHMRPCFFLLANRH